AGLLSRYSSTSTAASGLTPTDPSMRSGGAASPPPHPAAARARRSAARRRDPLIIGISIEKVKGRPSPGGDPHPGTVLPTVVPGEPSCSILFILSPVGMVKRGQDYRMEQDG